MFKPNSLIVKVILLKNRPITIPIGL